MGYPSQSCRRPPRKRSRNCSNLKRTKKVPQAEAEGQEITSSRFVDKWGRKWRTEISLGFTRLRVESGGNGFTLCCYTLGRVRRELRSCWDWHKTWKWQWRTFLELFFMRCWRNISLSHRQLSTGNQVLCGR